MDQSYSESDVSLSPSQILERLQVLRQLQLLQRGKLQKQRLDYQETSENSSGVTEIVSHFSNTTSYNTFRSLLETPQDSSNDGTPRVNKENRSPQLKQRDLIDGISVLNLSQESEFIVNSPVSARSQVSAPSRNELLPVFDKNNEGKTIAKKVIFLDDMPILSPKKDFESLVLEKLQAEKAPVKNKSPSKADIPTAKGKKPFLKRGQGTSRFGLHRKDFIIQNTKSLPWRQKSVESNSFSKKKKIFIEQENVDSKKVAVEILVTHPQKEVLDYSRLERDTVAQLKSPLKISDSLTSSTEKAREHPKQFVLKNLELPKGKQPLSKGKTWVNVFTKEQNDFLKQLKQSDYYKNFASPSKSSVSDTSCDETLSQMRYDKEMAEQNMFDLLENKVSHESFNLENSFFNRFLKRSKLNGSGESTPIVLQKCLANNPELMHIYPNLHKKTRQISQCESEYTDCCSETSSSVSSCSCKTIEESRIETKSENSTNNAHKTKNELSKKVNLEEKEVEMPRQIEKSKNITDNDTIKANMVEMNAKLIATSELLKERLCELEDEIETFRQENSSLTKMREEIDAERQKFYEEKNVFEQKFNEEKILSEYYLAEEKEKLTKQKQLYEKYVREMRGRLNKKEKDEVINLKKEINNLKEEMRVKDAKTTSTIARLRNQIKITEKEKKDLQEEIEKLKKENRRLHHSNDMTRRMTNLKYLEEINKKLSNITVKETQSEVNLDSNAKYKAFEIERQSRPRKIQAMVNKPLRTRAKSVPNLKVTSRYAKYFSQRDIASDMEKNQTVNELTTRYACPPYNEDSENEISVNDGSIDYNDNSEHEDENNLEKLYVERFGSTSARSSRSNLSNSSQQNNDFHGNPDTFFIQKPNSNKDSRSPGNAVSPLHNSSGFNSNKSKSPILDKSNSEKSPRNRYDDMQTNSAGWISNSSNISHNQSRSPISILTNRSSSNQKPETIIHKEQYRMHMNISPEPLSSKTSITKTILNPTEIKKPDGARELRFPNGNIKFIAADGKYSKFVYYNGDVKENFYNEGRIKYFYAGTKTYHTTYADGLEVLEFPDGQVEKRYKDGSTEIRLPNGSVRYYDPKNVHIREEWRFPDGAALTVSATGEQRIVFPNGQVEVHAIDHKRREFPDGTVKLVYNDGTSETRYASGRVRIKDKHGNLIMDSATG